MTDSVYYGFSYSCFLIVLVILILLIKKLLSRKLTLPFHYYIWLALPISAAAVVFPDRDFSFLPAKSALPVQTGGGAASGAPVWEDAADALRDFAVNSPTGLPRVLCLLLFAIWLAGAGFMLLRLGFALRRAADLTKDAVSFKADSAGFSACRAAETLLRLARPYPVKCGTQIQSPVTVGILRPQVLLPAACARAKETELRYILIHEFAHCKYRDPLINFLMQLFLCFNWMNPAVWYAVRQMETDREACCDHMVLNALRGRERIEYGHTLLSWAACGSVPGSVGMGGANAKLRRRILRIASYKSDSSLRKRGSALLLAAAMLLTFVLAPSAHGLSSGRFSPAKDLNITYENLQSYFEGQEGCFVLYSQREDRYIISGKTAAEKRLSPNSTYKIYSGLAALEAGVIDESASARPWDGTKYAFSQWNRSQDLDSAMKHSVNWYFQGLDQQVGRNRLQEFFNRIHYGNKNLSGGISSFWMESSLKISPLEQTMLLTDFYENQWNLSESSVRAVKNALLLSEKNGVRLSGKTGTGMKDGREINGWFIGYVESSRGLSVFALNLTGKDGASGSRAAQIALRILEDKGLL